MRQQPAKRPDIAMRSVTTCSYHRHTSPILNFIEGEARRHTSPILSFIEEGEARRGRRNAKAFLRHEPTSCMHACCCVPEAGLVPMRIASWHAQVHPCSVLPHPVPFDDATCMAIGALPHQTNGWCGVGWVGYDLGLPAPLTHPHPGPAPQGSCCCFAARHAHEAASPTQQRFASSVRPPSSERIESTHT